MDIDKIEQLVKTNTNEKHFLKIAKKSELPYYTGFIEQMSILQNILTEKQFDNLVQNKMQIGKSVFDQDQFVQAACETTVISYFAQKHAQRFKYENNTNPNNNTDVDCSFSENSFRFNMEVKCSIYIQEIPSVEKLKFVFVDRVSDYPKAKCELENMFEGVTVSKRKDNNLKDYLIKANEKFNSLSNEKEINILNVCCGNIDDIQKWHHYMYRGDGLFSQTPFESPQNYNLVDAVILNDLAHKHTFYSESTINDHWLYDKSFSLVFPNPYAKIRKGIGLNYLIENTPNYNKRFGAFIASREVTIIKEFINVFLAENSSTPF